MDKIDLLSQAINRGYLQRNGDNLIAITEYGITRLSSLIAEVVEIIESHPNWVTTMEHEVFTEHITESLLLHYGDNNMIVLLLFLEHNKKEDFKSLTDLLDMDSDEFINPSVPVPLNKKPTFH